MSPSLETEVAATVCPLCAARFEPAAHVRWRKDGHDIVQCPRCELLFRRDLPTADEVAAIYDLPYFKRSGDRADGYLDYIADEHAHRETASRRLDLLARFARRGALLDVGAAAGFFVAEGRARGWEAEGVDVSAAMVAWGREHLGVPLRAGTLSAFEADAESFDAVTMWDYIEHSTDPVADVRRVRALLRPGGVLALSTGDAGSAVARLSGPRWHLLTPRHHNFFFTRRTLTALLERCGFELLALDHRGTRYPVRYLAHKAELVAPGARGITRAIGTGRLGSIRVPLNLYDVATVVARLARHRDEVVPLE
jgi:2-polyprenyl-3-methyl-5-hydroxy-6-metoxy-1,4-benzoquinol methylase